MFKCAYCGAEFGSEEDAANHMLKHVGDQVQKQQEVMMQTNLLLAASQLTQICLISGKKPEEAMEVFSRLYLLLQGWHSGDSTKQDFMKWLDQQWGQGK